MPTEKQSALAALDAWFPAAVQSAAGALYASSAGKAAPEQSMIDRAEISLRLAEQVDAEMRGLIEKVFGS